MFFPSEAQREAALVALAYDRLQHFWSRFAGRPAPSLEVLTEEARRDPRRSLREVIVRKTVELR